MRVLIIEDEIPARAKLKAMLEDLEANLEVAASLGSVKESVLWLSNNPAPDLAFVDIQLSDSHSFEIFKQVPISFPVVFTTAYDKYLLESFEYNSIDYLLKPITEEKLKRSLEKMRKFQHHFLQGNIHKLIEGQSTPRPKRIIAKKGTEFIAFEIGDIAYFFTEHKVVFLRDFSGRQLIVDQNLSELEELVNNENFFRINRKFLAQRKAIEKFKPDSGKILIHLKPAMKEEIHVSKETAPLFRTWIGAS
jgi:DNA-binding LytR/AlgR family response regulator